MARRIRAARVKALRSYTVEEAAQTVGATPQTVRTWIRQGLPALTDQRPMLIMGWWLKDFLARAEASRRRPLRIGEFFCFSCKRARTAAMGMADYVPRSANHGLLRAFCAACEGTCTRVISASSLPAWTAIYGIGGTGTRKD